jgi:hypothetical protein
MKRKCLYCGQEAKEGELMVDVFPRGKRIISDIYVVFAWDVKFVHLDCLRPLPPEKKV